MECKIMVEITNLHACPGDTTPKQIEVSKDVFSQIDITKTTTEIETELALEQEKAKAEEKKRASIEALYAFKEENGEIIFRLGGAYGKIAGAIKEAASALYFLKAEGFKSGYKKFIKMLNFSPMWIPLQGVEKIEISKIPQILAGRSQAMQIFYYESIPKCRAELIVQVPDGEKTRFEALIKQVQIMPFGPKRRGELKIDIKWNDDSKTANQSVLT